MVEQNAERGNGGWIDGWREARKQPLLIVVTPLVLAAFFWALVGGVAAFSSVLNAVHAAEYTVTVTGTRSGACPIANSPPPALSGGPRYNQRDERCFLRYERPGLSERKVRLAQPSWTDRGSDRVVAVIDGPEGDLAVRTDTGSPLRIAATALGLFLGSEGFLVLLSILLVRRMNSRTPSSGE